MIRATVLGRKYSKKLSKPDLKATFSDVCLVKMELKSNDLRVQVFVLEKPYVVNMYRRNPRDEHYFHQQNKDRIKKTEDLQPRTKPVVTHYKNTYRLHLPWQKCLQSQFKRPFSPSPIAMLFTVTEEMYTWAVKPTQHCTRGGEGGEFVPFGHDGCMARNWKLHWNASTLLSGVVDFFAVILKREVFNGSTKEQFQNFLEQQQQQQHTFIRLYVESVFLNVRGRIYCLFNKLLWLYNF